jgi:membrane-associated phospholipid phosphatase
MPKTLLPLFVLFLTITLACQSQTTNTPTKELKIKQLATHDYQIRSFVIPAAMAGYGFLTLKPGLFKEINEFANVHIAHSLKNASQKADDLLQFSPAVMVYGLNIAGVKGKNNVVDQTLIYLMSNLILNGTVQTLKNNTNVQRPDLSDYRSFPSGHTAEAFASAEFLREEYKDKYPWIGYVGYGMAITTGYLRMYHQQHWIGDVVSGAGIGILSTRLSYILYPLIQKKLGSYKMRNTVMAPTFRNTSLGFQLVHHF